MFLSRYHLLITWISSAAAGNLALRQPSELSTVLDDRLGSYAVDGNPNGNPDGSPTKCAVTTMQADPYWLVDLGRTYIVDTVYILGRSDCCYERMFGLTIRVGHWRLNPSVNNPLCRSYPSFSGQLRKTASCIPALRGRYVSLHLSGNNRELTICEVKVNINPTANIAEGKSAYQTSMDLEGEAAKAVDGNSDSFFFNGYCTHTRELENNPWWYVDFGSSKAVSEVFIVNRVRGEYRLRDFTIRIGDIKGGNGSTNPICGNGLNTMATILKKSFYCKPRRTGRYLYISLQYTEVLTLCEVEVYSESKAVVDNDRATTIKGFPLSLKCEASGYPEPFIAWVRDGVVYQNTTETDTFRHDALNENHNTSDWECIVTNIHGSDFQTFTITEGEWHRMCAKNEVLNSKRTVGDVPSGPSSADGDDKLDNSVWFRLQHPTTLQPMQIPESCTPPMHCSTQATGWMLGSHPDIPDGVVRRTVCFSWDGNCCRYNTSILVRRCHGFYVYKLEKTSFDVKAGYCAENSEALNPNVIFKQVVTEYGPNYALENHVLHTEQDLDKYECFAVCLSHQSCQSINYDENRRYCEMNDATRHDVPYSDWKKTQGSTHYERANIIS